MPEKTKVQTMKPKVSIERVIWWQSSYIRYTKSRKNEEVCNFKKAQGEDQLLNEYFIEVSDIFVGHITEIFQMILDTGFFSSVWTE